MNINKRNLSRYSRHALAVYLWDSNGTRCMLRDCEIGKIYKKRKHLLTFSVWRVDSRHSTPKRSDVNIITEWLFTFDNQAECDTAIERFTTGALTFEDIINFSVI